MKTPAPRTRIVMGESIVIHGGPRAKLKWKFQIYFRVIFFLILITNNKYSFVKKNEQWKPIRGPYVIPTEHNFNWTNIMKELF